MKRLLLLFFFLGLSPLHAQINELGVFLGGSNYIGEVGPTDYISPKDLAFGIVYKWNRSPRHAYRISYMQSRISSKDIDSEVPGRNLRGYEFKNNLKELSLGLEFSFFDFNLHELEKKFTPYVYTGLSYCMYDELYVVDGETKKDGSSGAIAIPMIVGLKTNIMPNLILGFEVGTRYSFTDNFDGSNPADDNRESFRFGNINSKDWYVFTGFTLTYTFGEKPCYCAD